MAEGKLTTRELAEHAVDRHLEELAEMAPLRDEHITKSRETLRFYVASEDIPTITAELEQHVDAGMLDALVNGDEEVFFEVASTLEKKGTAWHLARGLFPLRFNDFSYQPININDGRVYVGLEGEECSGDNFYNGLSAESAHHLLHSLHHDVHGSISEFYEIALSWWTDPLIDKSFQCGCMNFRLETYVVDAMDAGGFEYFELIVDFLTQVFAEPEGHQQLSTFLWMTAGGYNEDWFDPPFVPKKMSRKSLEDELFDYIQFTMSRMSIYQEAHTIAWRLLENIMPTYDLSLEEAHDALTVAAVEALYDDEVDFSSRKRYIETILPKLPEYLNNE